MRLFALRDASNEEADILALLECYERDGSFCFELPPHADPWDLPFVLHEFAQRKSPTVDAHWSLRWVRSRLVPTDRQNLGEVLKVSGLDAYDELRLLELTGGRCSQDDCYLVPLGKGREPAWYLERLDARVTDVFALGGFRLLATFRDGQVVLCDIADMLSGERPFARILADEAAFERVAVQAGGHGARWGEALLVSSNRLRGAGHATGLSAADVASLVRQATLDTAEVTQLLGCTRQNVSDLVRRGRLVPIKSSPRGPLFLRADVYAWLDA